MVLNTGLDILQKHVAGAGSVRGSACGVVRSNMAQRILNNGLTH
jgi:hypothetical protein